MRALLAATGRPLAAPSANASGRISATRAAHVAATLGGRIPLILDSGTTEHGLESTIVAVEADRLRLLRPGPVTADALAAASGLPIAEATRAGSRRPASSPAIMPPPSSSASMRTRRGPDEWLIGFGAISGDDTLSTSGDPIEAAARLFEALHRADASGAASIAVAPVPADGSGCRDHRPAAASGGAAVVRMYNRSRNLRRPPAFRRLQEEASPRIKSRVTNSR